MYPFILSWGNQLCNNKSLVISLFQSGRVKILPQVGITNSLLETAHSIVGGTLLKNSELSHQEGYQ